MSRHQPKVGFVSLGCPKALVDSERIITQLRAEGYQVAPDYGSADVVVVNTCGFIDSAVDESLDAIGEALEQNGKVIVTGCLGARPERILERHPKVLKVTGPHAYEEVVSAVHEHLPPKHDPFFDLLPPQGIRLTPRHYAYLKISEGCDRTCTFCSIPKMRGKHATKPIEEVLKEAFGDPDETQSAERQLHQLHQKGPASDYAAKFRQVAAHLEWDDDPLMVAFYQGLKDEVKDELIKEDRPNTLAEYIATAVKIDDRLYERRQEKRKNGGGGWKQFKNNTNAANAKAKRRHPSTAYGHHSGPMEIDMAQKKFGKPKGKCYNCNKEGHFARECRAPKKLGWKPVPDDRNRQVNLAEANHASLTWTACFRDDCTTHKSDKEAAGWYPKRPKGKRSINMAFRATQGQEYEYDFRRDPRYRAFRLQELATQGHTQEEASQILSSQDLPTYPRRLPARNPNAAPRQLLREATIGNDAIDAVRIRSILAEDIHQRAAVRQDPEEAETIVISGVPTKQVRLREHNKGPMFGDDPRICHRDEKHEEISWVSCFCNACLDHLEDKTKHNWFPRRYRNQPVPNPYLKEELRYWTTRSRIGEAPYVILRPDPKYPWLCRMGGL